MPLKAVNDGASHFRHLQNACVTHASSSDHSGSRINECVMLRCHVTISNLSCENMSRKTSESGKIAPSISDQVTTRPRMLRCSGGFFDPRFFPCVWVFSLCWVFSSVLFSLCWVFSSVLFFCRDLAGARAKHILAAKNRLRDKRPRNAVRDGVHA